MIAHDDNVGAPQAAPSGLAAPTDLAAPSATWQPGLAWEIFLVVLLLLLLGLPNLVYPFGKDHGEYAYIATAFTRGETIYRDVFNVKPPGTHLLHAAAIQLFGANMMSIRILDLGWQTATAVVLCLIANLLYRQRYLGLLVGVIYGVVYYAADFWHSAQTDSYINLLAALAVLLFVLAFRGGRRWLWFLSGLAIGLAVLVKYPIGILLSLLLLFLLATRRGRAWRPLLLMVAGFALPLLLFLAVLIGRGSLADFLTIQLGYIPRYNAGFRQNQTYLAYSWQRLRGTWLNDGKLRWFGAIWALELLQMLLLYRRRRLQWLVPLWGVAALIHPAVQNQYYYSHMQTLLAPLSLMIAHLAGTLAAAAGRLTPRLRPVVLAAAFLLPLWLLAAPISPYQHQDPAGRYRGFWQILTGQEELDDHYRLDAFGLYNWGVFSSRATMEVAEYLREKTQPGERVFVWGFEPGIYFLSHRGSASRFIYNFPVYGRFAWPEFRQELVAELERTQPAAFIVAERDEIPWISGSDEDSATALEGFGPLKAFLDEHYVKKKEIAQFTIYFRRQ